MASLTLDEWLAYQAKVHPQTIDLGLERLHRVLERLGWRQPGVPVITVAGTNGKGSVAAYTTAFLTAAGLRVGTFTSPHLRAYRERVRLENREATDVELVGAFERIEAARGAVSLTFFEYNALAAILIFEAARLDAWVLEIGMGGRLDAANVVDPSVAVIVTIGLDHQEYLGHTLEAIAREKAGILRPGVPAVLGSLGMPPVLEEIARAAGAPLKRLGVEYTFARHGERWSYRGPCWDLTDLPTPALAGAAQYANAAAGIAAVEALQPRIVVPATALCAGLASVRLAGRFQVIEPAAPGTTPTFILDVAHNPDAARVLAANLRAQIHGGRTFAVCGMLEDKDAAGVAMELGDSADAWWLTTIDGARGLDGAALAARIAPQVSAPICTARNVAGACEAALAAAQTRDRIVIFGSFHVVGPALDWLESRGFLTRTADTEKAAAAGQK